jgi:hypothetical protein
MRALAGQTFVKYAPSFLPDVNNLPVGSLVMVVSVCVDRLGHVVVWAFRLDNNEQVEIDMDAFLDYWALDLGEDVCNE